MNIRHLQRMICLGALLLLAACANQNSIFRRHLADSQDPVVFTMDAKQRNLLAVPDGDAARRGIRSWRICAEAAPDVFSALSTSAAADVGVGTDASRTDAKAQLALSLAEAAGTIERTQTVNLLRESMYRTCERYMSGAIDRATFVVQAGRDWRAMIAILAIEQLTRSAKPPATLLIPGSTSASVVGQSQLAGEYAAAKARQRDAAAQVETLKATSAKTCPTEEGDAKTKCEAEKKSASDALPAAQAALDQRNKDVDELVALAKELGGQSSSSASTAPNGQSVPGQGPTPPAPTDMAKIADVVGEITESAMDTDETQLFCLQALSYETPIKGVDRQSVIIDGAPRSVSDLCLEYLGSKVASSLFTKSVEAGRRQAIERKRLQQMLTDNILRLSDAEFKARLPALRQKFGSFCPKQGNSEPTKETCAAWIAAGSLAGVNNNDLDQVLKGW